LSGTVRADKCIHAGQHQSAPAVHRSAFPEGEELAEDMPQPRGGVSPQKVVAAHSCRGGAVGQPSWLLCFGFLRRGVGLSRRRGKGSGAARPRSGLRALTSTGVRVHIDIVSRRRADRRLHARPG
jgi:hypothetical protein